jgi:hypothetical protein
MTKDALDIDGRRESVHGSTTDDDQ